MPHYDYQCRTCGKRFEFFQSMTSDALTHCPDSVCEQQTKGVGAVERRIGKGAGLIFNGSGFYLTDYVKNSGKSEPAPSGATTETSTAAAPAAPAPTTE